MNKLNQIKAYAKDKGITFNPRCELVEKNGQSHLYLEGAVMPDEYAWEDERHISAAMVRQSLQNVGDVIIHLNSPGGSIYEGVGIYNILKDHPGTVTVQIDGMAASIATVMCMGADKVQARTSSIFMIHRGWMVAIGNAVELRKAADDLEVIDGAANSAYMEKFNGTKEELYGLLDAESYLTAEDAFAYGFIDEILDKPEEEPEPQPEPLQLMPTLEPVAGLFDRFKKEPTGSNFFEKFRGNK